MKKKITTSVLAFLLTLNLTACQNTRNDVNDNNDLETEIFLLESDNNILNDKVSKYEEDIKKCEEKIENLHNQIDELISEKEVLEKKLKEVEMFMETSYKISDIYVVKITDEDGISKSIITTSSIYSYDESKDSCRLRFTEHTLPEDFIVTSYRTSYVGITDNVEVAYSKHISVYTNEENKHLICVYYKDSSNQYMVDNSRKYYWFYGDENILEDYKEYENSYGSIEIKKLTEILPINETNTSYSIAQLKELENELNNDNKLLLEP